MRSHHRGVPAALALTLTLAVGLSACGTATTSDSTPGTTGDSTATAATTAGDSAASGARGDDTAPAASSTGDDPASGTGEPLHVTEAAGPQPRLAYTYDGGVTVLDGTSLKEIADIPLKGFTRLADLGDQHHLLVTEGSTWRVLDLGTWTKAHGDHGHSFTSRPRGTDITFSGEHPGHAVHEHGRTMLFSDGEGTVQTLDAHDIADIADGRTPHPEVVRLKAPHHGVAVPLENGGMVVTAGTEDERSTIEVRDKAGTVLAKTDDCPGVHGEAVVKGAMTFGCEDGMVIIKGAGTATPTMTKVKAPVPYARLGNQRSSEVSPIAFADYKTDKDADPIERPTKVALVDTRSNTLRTVELGTSYWFRSLGRTPAGDGLVLGYDGALHVVDVEAGKVTSKVPVIKPWREADDWQTPGPNLYVQGRMAYITEPATKKLHAVDLQSLKVTRSADLSQVPNELDGVTGEQVDDLAGDHSGHDHSGHDHSDEHSGHEHGGGEHADHDH